MGFEYVSIHSLPASSLSCLLNTVCSEKFKIALSIAISICVCAYMDNAYAYILTNYIKQYLMFSKKH